MANVRGKVLIVDDDRDIADIVSIVLTDAGFQVSVLMDIDPNAIRAAVGRLEPDCVLLNGGSPAGYASWDEAAWLGLRERQVPVIMFSTHQGAVREAQEHTSARSQAARFHAVLGKPFDIDELVDTVVSAVGAAAPFDTSLQAEQHRTEMLKARLEAAGARDIHMSTRREWANFRTPDGTIVQIYWWQRDGAYYVVRHAQTGSRLDQVGRFYDLDAAIALGMLVRTRAD
jgi:DNA-binding response OmpR family regulator